MSVKPSVVMENTWDAIILTKELVRKWLDKHFFKRKEGKVLASKIKSLNLSSRHV